MRIGDPGISAIIKSSFINLLDWEFLTQGGYTQVTESVTSANLIDDDRYLYDNVYQLTYKNLVWENGYSSFTNTITGNYQIDVLRGRVACETAQSFSITYRYKSVYFDSIEECPTFHRLQQSYVINEEEIKNVSDEIRQFPAVLFSHPRDIKPVGYDLGSPRRKTSLKLRLHVLGNENTVEQISDYLVLQNGGKFAVNYNSAVDVLPYDFNGIVTNNTSTYPNLLSYTTLFLENSKFYIESAIKGSVQPIYERMFFCPINYTISTIINLNH